MRTKSIMPLWVKPTTHMFCSWLCPLGRLHKCIVSERQLYNWETIVQMQCLCETIVQIHCLWETLVQVRTYMSEMLSKTYTLHNEKNRTYVYFLKINSIMCSTWDFQWIASVTLLCLFCVCMCVAEPPLWSMSRNDREAGEWQWSLHGWRTMLKGASHNDNQQQKCSSKQCTSPTCVQHIL